jgi:hypothetical protein
VNFDRRAAGASGGLVPAVETGTGADVTDNGERRTNHALRQRVDSLIDRVHAAREEIVEKGLDAVRDEHGGIDPDDATPEDRRSDDADADARA